MTTTSQPSSAEQPPEQDVIVYNAPIDYPGYYEVLNLCRIARHDRVLLLLTTDGGNPHAAYRIARSLSDAYEHVTAFITSFCKSAGTLVVLGANEIVIGDAGELGPLDIQISKKEELGEQWSGNDLAHGLTHAMQHALHAYRTTFIDICLGAGLSAAISADAAAKLVTGMYGRIFEQIDPSRLGEVQRANQISLAYGKRLVGNDPEKLETLRRLVLEYPSHGFVIDRAEAEELFSNARAPTPSELALTQPLLDLLKDSLESPGVVKRIFPQDESPHEIETTSHKQRPASASSGRNGGGSGDLPPRSTGAGKDGGASDLERGEGNRSPGHSQTAGPNKTEEEPHDDSPGSSAS